MTSKSLSTNLAAVALAGITTHAAATNGDNMIGLTAIQNGMAGAVVAAPQEATTVLINPAGMAMLDIKDVRFDLGLGFLNPPRKVNGYESDSNLYMMPTGAVAFHVNDKLTLGMGLGGISGMGVDFSDTTALSGNQFVVTTKQFFKVSPGLAYRINDALAIGGTINLNYQSLALANPLFSLPQNQVFGWGITAGAIWKPNSKMQLGISWSSKQKMSDFEWNTAQGKVSMRMDAPQTLAFGIAFKPTSNLLIEADVKRIWFANVLDMVPVKRPAGSPVPAAFNFGWSNQTVFAIGVQKDIGGMMQIRAGFNYGKSPIGSEDVNQNFGSLAVVEKHLTFGLSRKFSDKVIGSLSYVHAFNNSVTSNTSPNTIELKQNIINFQISYQY
ncbi:OmpP1/FadL family transporter [Sulfuricystis thermophila]|uniref:OmpP1/FadL family transporter n=1 Tax=Sulfuricystis thermophila TaxID=2496847 RepID=UPI0010365A96|nr:outer membrane protein transport protein [Sulfuricystis thermophila]